MESTFARWPRWAAALILFAVAALMAGGLVAPEFPAARVLTGADTLRSDQALYVAVLDRVQRGEDFYEATAFEQRDRGYPLRPFVTVRPPWLTRTLDAVGGRESGKRLLQILVALATLAMAARLFITLRPRLLKMLATLATLSFGFVVLVSVFWYEAWCAALILLALACWSDRTWGVSIVLGVAAAALRELAAPFLLVMLACALYERRWKESVGWGAGMLAFAAILTSHAAQVHAVSSAADRASPGWVSTGGWPYILRMVHDSTVLIVGPMWLVAILVPLSLLGWAHWSHPVARRALLYLVGFMCSFMIVGRPTTIYWGMLMASLVLIGVAFAPQAIVVLVRRLRDASAIPQRA